MLLLDKFSTLLDNVVILLDRVAISVECCVNVDANETLSSPIIRCL